MKDIILKEIQESSTKFLRAMQDEQGREWIVTIVKNPKNKEEMHFQTPFLIKGKAVPALEEIERQLQAHLDSILDTVDPDYAESFERNK